MKIISDSSSTAAKLLAILLAVLLLCLLVGFGPILTIWSINTLFNTGIAYTIWTWISAVFLMSVFGRGLVFTLTK